MRVLVVGASGLVGSNLLNELKSKNILTLGSHYSFPTESTFFLDTQNFKALATNEVIRNFAPNVIIHCGALTHVDKCEIEPKLSRELTVESTINLLNLAQELKAKFVYISTDYVFDGKSGPYTEDEPINPINVYGEHKALAENLVATSGLSFLILRITNVYGNEIRGKNFVSRIISLSKNKETTHLNLPIDQFATPVNASLIAEATYHLLYNKLVGIYNISSTDYLNRVQLADRVLKYFPYEGINIEKVETKNLNQAAKRPLFGGLINKKICQALPEFSLSNLDDYLSTL